MRETRMDDAALLGEAIALAAANAREGGGPFGAVVARGGEVIGRGVNQVTAEHDPTAHAEVQAIRAACRALGSHELAGCTLYASCEPCPMCLGAILWARVGKLVYAASREDAAAAGFDDSVFHDEVSRPAAERELPSVHLPHPDTGTPFAAWRVCPRRRPY